MFHGVTRARRLTHADKYIGYMYPFYTKRINNSDCNRTVHGYHNTKEDISCIYFTQLTDIII